MTPKVSIVKCVDSDITQFFGLVDPSEFDAVCDQDIVYVSSTPYHYCDVRFWDEASLSAVIKACRAGILGRGSLGRFHCILESHDGTHMIVPLFKKGDICWVSNEDVVMQCFTVQSHTERVTTGVN